MPNFGVDGGGCFVEDRIVTWRWRAREEGLLQNSSESHFAVALGWGITGSHVHAINLQGKLLPLHVAMSNLTISVDAELMKRARVRAIEQGTSLSAKVREFLQTYVDDGHDRLTRQRQEATARLIAAMESATPASRSPATTPAGSSRRRTLREDLYVGDFRERDRRRAAPGNAKRAAKR